MPDKPPGVIASVGIALTAPFAVAAITIAVVRCIEWIAQ